MRHLVSGSKDNATDEEEKVPVPICDDNDDDEEGYFTGYAHFSIHHDMLALSKTFGPP